MSTPLDRTHRKVLTSQWSCEAGRVGAGPRLGLHRPQALGFEEPWAGSPRVGQVGRPGPGSHSRVLWPDLRQGQRRGCRGLGRRALHGKGAAAALGPLGSQRQRPGNPERSTVGKPGPQLLCQDKGCCSLGGAWAPADSRHHPPPRTGTSRDQGRPGGAHAPAAAHGPRQCLAGHPRGPGGCEMAADGAWGSGGSVSSQLALTATAAACPLCSLSQTRRALSTGGWRGRG